LRLSALQTQRTICSPHPKSDAVERMSGAQPRARRLQLRPPGGAASTPTSDPRRFACHHLVGAARVPAARGLRESIIRSVAHMWAPTRLRPPFQGPAAGPPSPPTSLSCGSNSRWLGTPACRGSRGRQPPRARRKNGRLGFAKPSSRASLRRRHRYSVLI
jgi:hypothetical protein